jgi:hypothetical protein
MTIPRSYLLIKAHLVITFIFILTSVTASFSYPCDGACVDLLHLPNFIGITGMGRFDLGIRRTY